MLIRGRVLYLKEEFPVYLNRVLGVFNTRKRKAC